MLLIIACIERLLHIGSHFSLRKWQRAGGSLIFLQNWRWWPHFPTNLAAAASFSNKIGGSGKDLATLQAAVLTWSRYWRKVADFGEGLISLRSPLPKYDSYY